MSDLITIRQRKPTTKEERIASAIIHPEQFATYFLGSELWDKQVEILKAIATKPRVAVKACHSSSKTYTAARAALWFLARYKEAIVVTTAPSWGQVEKLLWGEIHAALQHSRYPFPEANQTELKMGPKRYAYGLATSVTKQDEGVKFQGIHAENVLMILDEAPGVDPKIWEAIEGARAGGDVHVLAIGNPTISSGPFHDAFTENRSGWVPFTISAFDTPNLRGVSLEQLLNMSETELDQNVKGYLTTRRWVYEKYYEWGPGHPLWESRVLGNFPAQSEDALLSLTWLEQAQNNKKVGVGKLMAGLDVAGPGEDETTLTIRRGQEIILQTSWPHEDPRGEVVAALNPYKYELEAVNVDCIGIGWGMYQHLSDLKFPTRPINVSEQSSDPEKYLNQKAEHYWGLRMRFAAGDCSGLVDEKTIGQLAGIRYKHNSRGQIEIESKEQAAKRGVKSPDRAESIMLAFAANNLIYGVNEYYKQEAKNIVEKIQGAILMKPTRGDEQMSCPNCSSTCVVRAQGRFRCNECASQWSGPGDKQVPKQFNRKDALAK